LKITSELFGFFCKETWRREKKTLYIFEDITSSVLTTLVNILVNYTI